MEVKLEGVIKIILNLIIFLNWFKNDYNDSCDIIIGVLFDLLDKVFIKTSDNTILKQG